MTFDGTTRRITLDPGEHALDALDLYARYKDWVSSGQGAPFPEAVRAVGGAPLPGGRIVSPYVFLLGGWRVVPDDVAHELVVTGALVTDTGETPYQAPPTASVFVRDVVPVLAQTVAISGGGATPSGGFTEADRARAQRTENLAALGATR